MMKLVIIYVTYLGIPHRKSVYLTHKSTLKKWHKKCVGGVLLTQVKTALM